jgi:aerobic carbon-monoxide dehydrogenase medium subunit
MTAYDYVEPTTVEGAVAALAEHGEDAHVIAGGASMVLMLRQQLLVPSILVGLRGIPDLRGITPASNGSLWIGATTTHRQIERSPHVAAYAEALADAFSLVATVRVRNQGTIGGNLAHADPAQDPPPILLALDAMVHATGPTGARVTPIQDLFVDTFETSLAPDEVITGVELPVRPADAAAVYLKFLPASRDDYATVSVAVSARIGPDGWRDVRVALGAAAPVPLRVPAAEARLDGVVPDGIAIAEAAAAVADAVDPLTDSRGSAEYKRDMAVVWTRRALERLAGRRPDEAAA